MRKVILFIATSLDGYIADENGQVDWLYHDQDYGYKRFYDSVDTLIMGRKTYDQIKAFGAWPYEKKKTFVFTSKVLKDMNILTSKNSILKTKELIKNKGKDIWLVGGAQIIRVLLNENLINELRLFVQPIILGKGIPLFHNIKRNDHLKLKDIKKYSSGMVQLRYISV